jgi:hypothetical protein
MKLNLIWLLTGALVCLVLAGCSPASLTGLTEATAPVQTTDIIATAVNATAVQPAATDQHPTILAGSPTPEEESMPGIDVKPPNYNPALQPLVSQAVDDLAQRLRLEPAQIEVIEARAVVWPDASLGCPQPGMRYIQVPQDGALVRLRAAGQDYEYHSGGGQGLFLCEQTFKVKETPPKIDILPPTPGEDN